MATAVPPAVMPLLGERELTIGAVGVVRSSSISRLGQKCRARAAGITRPPIQPMSGQRVYRPPEIGVEEPGKYFHGAEEAADELAKGGCVGGHGESFEVGRLRRRCRRARGPF